jgi:Beta-propeller repeat
MSRKAVTVLPTILILTFLASAFGAPSSHTNSLKSWFEENNGQVSREVKYLQRGTGYTLFFTPQATTLQVLQRNPQSLADTLGARGAALRIVWEGAHPQNLQGEREQAGKINYLNISDSARNVIGVRTYGEIRYTNLYLGINLAHYSNGEELEHDFHIAPDADPSRIVMRFEGPDSLNIEKDGTLLVRIGEFSFHQLAPFAYQVVNGVRRAISVQYATLGGSRIGFHVGPYDRHRELVIDPVLRYSTFVGGAHAVDFDGNAISSTVNVGGLAVDQAGNAYFAGQTSATDYPTTPGAFNRTSGTDCERGAPACASSTGFITKLNAEGSGLVYSTYITLSSNGPGVDTIAVDQAGNAYFTTTMSCSDCEFQSVAVGKLNPAGSALDYSFTFQGTCFFGFSRASALAVNGAGEAYVAGGTDDSCLPITDNALQKTFTQFAHAGFIFHLNTDGTQVLEATYLASPPSSTDFPFEQINDLKLDSAGNVYVSGGTDFPATFPHSMVFGQIDPNDGRTSFVAKLDPTLSSLIFSSEVAGSIPTGLALGPGSQPYIAGSVINPGFPTTPGAFQTSFTPATCGEGDVQFPCSHAFVVRLSGDGSALVFSTLVTGSGNDGVNSIAVDFRGDAYITGNTTSPDFPITAKPLQMTFPKAPCNTADGSCNPAFVSVLRRDGSQLEFSTFLGGRGNDLPVKIAVDSDRSAYVTGSTSSADFPTTRNAFQRTLSGQSDAFVSKIRR